MKLFVEKLSGLPSPPEVFREIKDQPRSFFFDSGLSVGGLGAYSFLGFSPFLTVRAAGQRCFIEEMGSPLREETGDSLKILRSLLFRFQSANDSVFPFAGGAVGYLSYEYGASWESVAPRERAVTDKDEPMADFEFAFYDGVLAYEHSRNEWFVLANPVHRASVEEIRARMLNAILEVTSTGACPAGQDATSKVAKESGETFQRDRTKALRTNAPSAEADAAWYISAVRKIKDYIAAGDVYQVNLAQRFRGEWRGTPFELFSRLRVETPAPFAAYLTTSFGQILSCSPERFVRLLGREVETRPIKGTRRRGASAEEEFRLAQELQASAKERAELLMIVDLERNDLGRVCRPGTIRVSQLYQVEVHPTVLHLVATVRGEIEADRDAIDLLRATFPGGSITGAPKIRAMEIIRELEASPRGVYTGAIGFLGFDGNCDFNIAIRTVVLRGSEATFHVGAGIVWDSEPTSEYEETLIKGRALLAAFESP